MLRLATILICLLVAPAWSQPTEKKIGFLSYTTIPNSRYQAFREAMKAVSYTHLTLPTILRV